MRHGAFRALQAASPLRSSDHRAVRATCELQVRSGDIRGVVKILITGRRWNLHGHRIPFCGAQAFVCGLMSDAVSGQTSTCRSRRKASGGPNTGRIDTPHEGMGENFHDEETHTAPTRSPTDHRRLAAPSSWWGGLANVKHLSGGIDSISVSYIEVTHTGRNRPGNTILSNLLWRD